MAKARRNTRQKMINLMYLVFIAMLAINYPEEVLDGFDLINEKLTISLQNTEKKNAQIYDDFEMSYKVAPDKTETAYQKAQKVKTASDSLYSYIQQLKLSILKETDGEDGNLNNIKGKDNLSASSIVMFNMKNGQGKKLRQSINNYRTKMSAFLQDSIQKQILASALSTTPSVKRGVDKKSWEESSFESMPTIASITYLTELQSNVRSTEGAVLNNLLKDIDIADLRVNRISALVVPQSNIIMRGGTYSANIIMAAVDSIQQPSIVINGKELPAQDQGHISIPANATGKHKIEGYISIAARDGSVVRRDFMQSYTVIEPMVTIAPTLMDVLYANFNNPLSISVPGVPNQNISVSANGGSISTSGSEWIARPSKAGQNMTISVTFRMEGDSRTQTLSKTFRVRSLPDPSAYILVADAQGTQKMFKSGAISKNDILQAGGIKAAIDDGVLNIPFQVISFSTYTIDAMGNAMPEVSNGSSLSAKQIEQIKKLGRGRTLLIHGIRVKGPDGSERSISPMEIRIN